MTEIIDIKTGSIEEPNKVLKPIKLVKMIVDIVGQEKIRSNIPNVNSYDYASLVKKGDKETYDVILCWDEYYPEARKVLFLGFWNDGIVENEDDDE